MPFIEVRKAKKDRLYSGYYPAGNCVLNVKKIIDVQPTATRNVCEITYESAAGITVMPAMESVGDVFSKIEYAEATPEEKEKEADQIEELGWMQEIAARQAREEELKKTGYPRQEAEEYLGACDVWYPRDTDLGKVVNEMLDACAGENGNIPYSYVSKIADDMMDYIEKHGDWDAYDDYGNLLKQ